MSESGQAGGVGHGFAATLKMLKSAWRGRGERAEAKRQTADMYALRRPINMGWSVGLPPPDLLPVEELPRLIREFEASGWSREAALRAGMSRVEAPKVVYDPIRNGSRFPFYIPPDAIPSATFPPYGPMTNYSGPTLSSGLSATVIGEWPTPVDPEWEEAHKDVIDGHGNTPVWARRYYLKGEDSVNRKAPYYQPPVDLMDGD